MIFLKKDQKKLENIQKNAHIILQGFARKKKSSIRPEYFIRGLLVI
jgi:hypothetical protein